MTASKPNIVFVFSDQQRWDTVGCYGQPLPITPNLDRMAAEGVRFDRAFTPQPVCGPARSCLQTGRYATENRCHINNTRLPAGQRTIAHALSEAGYEVGYIGKWHLASCGPSGGVDDFKTRPIPPDRRGGYDDYWLASDLLEFTSHAYDGHMFDGEDNRREFPPGRYRADVLTDWALEYLQTRDGERPFFLFLSYIEPHHQNDANHYQGPKGSKERFADFVPPADLAALNTGDWREEYPDYLGCVHALDANLGRIRAELERLGLAADTLVIYTSDHGSHFRTRVGEYKRACHDACIRVPMIACGPGFRGGKVIDELVSLIDLPPTILSTGDAEPLNGMRGRPLQPLAAGQASDRPKEIFLQISESQCGRAIRTDRWKYSVRAPGEIADPFTPASSVYVEEYLYDLHADPHELSNLVATPELADLRAELAETLKRRMVAAGEVAPQICPAD